MTLTQTEIQSGLRGLGLFEGDSVIVHSSLSSLGWVEGGAGAVVDALIGAVGERGTVVMPTFTPYDVPFHPRKTASTTGRITEELRTREAARRSDHPTKSVAALGPDADALTDSHPLMESLGRGSPMHRALTGGGSVLLLGVDHTSNSSLHVGEKLADVPYRDQVAQTARIDQEGREETVTVNRVHCSQGFETFDALARRANIVRDGRIGDAKAQLIDGQALLDEVVQTLRRHPGFLLCDRPDCDRCAYARGRIASEA